MITETAKLTAQLAAILLAGQSRDLHSGDWPSAAKRAVELAEEIMRQAGAR